MFGSLFSILNPTGQSLAAEFWQTAKGKGFSPVCLNKFKRDICKISKGAPKPCDTCHSQAYQPLSEAMFSEHLAGRKRYGIYPLGQDGLTAWIAADLDNHDGKADPKADLLKILEVARSLEIPLQVFNSNSGAGFHIYLFFEQPIAAQKARLLLLTIIARAEVKSNGQGGSFDAVFPKQDRLEPGDSGNLIALPFHGKAMVRKATMFLNSDNGLKPYGGSPEENQDYFLENLTSIDEAEADRLLHALGMDNEGPRDTVQVTQWGQSNERLAKLIEGCAFLRHCRDDASDLLEPEWYLMVCLLAAQYGGPALIHELSRPYPGYSRKETDEKITHALNDSPGPPTCEAIKKIWDCVMDCRVSTPLGLLRTPKVKIPGIPKKQAPEWPAPLREQAFHGIAGEFVELIEPHTEADSAALLVQFLAGFGNLVGRTSYFTAEADHHYPNVFAVMVGETSKGRKGSSFGQVKRLLLLIDETWAGRIKGGLSSGEGLIWSVRDPITKREPTRENGRVTGYQEIEADPGEGDKRLFVVEPEFASVLRVSARDGNTLSPVVRQSWDTGDLRTLTTGRSGSLVQATEAYVSIIGHVTKDELRRYLDRTEAGNGFANRFLWCCVCRSKCLPEGGGAQGVNLDSLVIRLKDALTMAYRGEVRRDDEAREIWAAVYPDLSEGKPGLFGAVTSRSEAQVMRLALIYALLDQSPLIKKEHLLAALAVWDYCEASARYIFGDAVGDPVADSLVDALKTSGAMTRTEISNFFGRNVSSGRIQKALSALETQGIAKREPVDSTEGAGRPVERWSLA